MLQIGILLCDVAAGTSEEQVKTTNHQHTLHLYTNTYYTFNK